MTQLYAEYEGTQLWECISEALADLERNGDVALTTARPHIIGYLCRALTRAGVVVGVSGHDVPLVLRESEALVLFDLLARSGNADSLVIGHPAENRVLWRIEGALERRLAAPFDAAYAERLAAAHAEVIGQEE